MNQIAAVRRAAVLAAGILALVAGCGGAWARQQQDPPPAPAPSGGTAPGTWEIEYDLTGGFAGVRRRLSVSSSGRLVAEDLRRKAVVERQADPTELADLAGMLADADANGPAERGPSLSRPCADCFEHSLTVVIDGRAHRARMNDLSLRGSPHAPLIGRLSQMLRQMLSGAGPRR